VALVADAFWRRDLGEAEFREGVVIEVDGVRREVIGLMPADFRFRWRSSIWVPLPVNIESVSLLAEIRNDQSRRVIESLGNSALAPRGVARSPASGWQILVQDPQFRGKNRVSMSLAKGFFVLSALLLLAAGLTAGSLLQARTLRRQRADATALALGVSRFALVRDSVIEHSILACAAAVVGIGLTSSAIRAFAALLPRDLPDWLKFELDWRVVAFVTSVMAIVIVFQALATAREIARLEPATALAEASMSLTASASRSRRAAAIVRWQVVIVLPLMVSASIVAMQHAAVAWEGKESGLKGSVDAFAYLHDARQEDVSVRTSLTDQVAARLAHDPRVDVVSRYGQPLGLRGGRKFEGYRLFNADAANDHALEAGVPWTYATDSAYFIIRAQPLLLGRHFAPRDTLESTLAMIVESSHALSLWGSTDVIGRRARIGSTDGPLAEVVGVVADRKEPVFSGSRLVLTGRSQIYLSRWQLVDGQPRLSVRATSVVEGAIAALSDAGAGIDRSIEIVPSRLAEAQRLALLPLRVVTAILVAVAGFVHALVVAGIFALAHLRIAERRQEIGVRLAVGAPPLSLQWMLIKDTLREVVPAFLLGTVLSSIIAVSASRLTSMPVATLLQLLFVSVALTSAAVFGAVSLPLVKLLRFSPAELLRSRF
jgi:hypothetical protein